MAKVYYTPAEDPSPYADDRIRERRGGRAGKAFAAIALLVFAGVFAAWAAGLFTVQTDGAVKAPTVSIEGGALPNVEVEAANVEVGTTTKTVEVPTVEVTKPEQPGN